MEDTRAARTERKKTTRIQRTCRKECAVIVDIQDYKTVSAYAIIKSLEKEKFDVLAVIPQGGNTYEITVGNEQEAKLISNEGITIGDETYECRLLFNDSTVVSFFELPAYISDDDVKSKLTNKGIELLGPLNRNYYPDTDVYNGTRHIRCKFPPNYTSLPYSMKFETVQGSKYYKVKHNNQCKVCFNCDSPDHVLKDCPKVECYRCKGLGHTSKSCPNPTGRIQRRAKCDICFYDVDYCTCYDEDDYDLYEKKENEEDEESITGNSTYDLLSQDEEETKTSPEKSLAEKTNRDVSGHKDSECNDSVNTHTQNIPVEMTPVPTNVFESGRTTHFPSMKRTQNKRNQSECEDGEGFKTAETKKQRRAREKKAREDSFKRTVPEETEFNSGGSDTEKGIGGVSK